MFTILIQEKGGEQRRMVFNKPEVTIGRVQGNDIVLPKGNVSKRHARIVLKDGKFIIVDLKSTNGTYVNGRKITPRARWINRVRRVRPKLHRCRCRCRWAEASGRRWAGWVWDLRNRNPRRRRWRRRQGGRGRRSTPRGATAAA